MNRPLYYYAKLNESDICYGFETLAKKFKEDELPSNLIPLPEYNESLLWRKWDRNLKAWSSEKFEPDTDFELLERLDVLETENEQLRNEVISLNATITNLNQNINLLENTIVELTSLIALLQGGDI